MSNAYCLPTYSLSLEWKSKIYDHDPNLCSSCRQTIRHSGREERLSWHGIMHIHTEVRDISRKKTYNTCHAWCNIRFESRPRHTNDSPPSTQYLEGIVTIGDDIRLRELSSTRVFFSLHILSILINLLASLLPYAEG